VPALRLLFLAGMLLAAPPAGAAGGLNGQTGTVEWRVPNLSVDPLITQDQAPSVVTRDFTVGNGPAVTDLGFYPTLSLEATDDALVFTFSEGWCCLSVGSEPFVGPVVTFTSMPGNQDLQVVIGDSSIPLTMADLLVDGNRIAIDLRGRDISGGRITLLVRPGSNLAMRATLALIGIGLIALGSVRRRWA
jgi:hypothetical protein